MKGIRHYIFIVSILLGETNAFISPLLRAHRDNYRAVQLFSESPRHEIKHTSKHKMTSKQKKKYEEFQWLNWVYNQWRPTKPGELSTEVLKQMAPAISSWGRRKTLHAAERAEELLERLIEENLAGNLQAELTVSLFNAAMDGFAKIGNPEGVQRILRRMSTISTEHEHLAFLKPDVFSMSTLATAWAKSRSPDAASKATAILKYMDTQGLAPNTITYNSVLHAIAIGHDVDKAVQAEDLVNKMKERHSAGQDCRPDIYSYQCLIQAWARTSLPGSPQKAEQILRFLDKQSEEGNKSLSPNAHCFTTTIHAWARSDETGRARSAYELLQHMRKRYMENFNKKLKPNVIAFTAVINACARPVDESEWEEAFQIAQLTMAELSLGTYDSPNFLSYAAFLSVCLTALPPGEDRDNVVKKTFSECVNTGQVGQIVMEKLKFVASPDLYEELVGDFVDDNGEYSLPLGWTSNIKGERHEKHVNRTTIAREPPAEISLSSKLRLKAVQKFKGKSGFYSSGLAPRRLESEGISWSKTAGF